MRYVKIKSNYEDPKEVFRKISKSVFSSDPYFFKKSSCHAKLVNELKKNNYPDNYKIVLIGKDDLGVTHSLIADDKGNIVFGGPDKLSKDINTDQIKKNLQGINKKWSATIKEIKKLAK